MGSDPGGSRSQTESDADQSQRRFGFAWLGGAVVLIVFVVLAVIASGHQTRDIPDEMFLPVPDGLVLEADDGGDCGFGNDFECGRIFVVTLAGLGADEAVARSIEHLRAIGEWPEFEQDGQEFTACIQDGHICARGRPFDWPDSLGTERSRFWADHLGIDEGEVPQLLGRAAEVSFSDCCGNAI